jgi:peptidoglycan/LPS O-acetylase OafA/YrhL
VPNRLYYSELGHTWSLAVEEQFYFLWPWVVLFFKKYGLLLVALLLLLLAIIALIQLPTLRLSFNGKAYFVGESFHADRFFLPAIAPIMIGSIAAVFHFFYAHRAARFCISTLGKLLIAITATAAFWLPAFLQPYLFYFTCLMFCFSAWFYICKTTGYLNNHFRMANL